MTANPALTAWLAWRHDVEQWREHEQEHLGPRLVDGTHLAVRPGVPASRDACRGGCRPCGYLECRWHLWVEPDEGRPWNGPRYTVRSPYYDAMVTRRYGQRLGLSPAQAERVFGPPVNPPSCGLDIAEQTKAQHRRGMTTAEVAKALGRHPTLIRAELRSGLRKLKAAGMAVAELEAVMDSE